jgi:gluconolactonase
MTEARGGTMQPHVVVDGIRVGEGPTWRAATSDLFVTSVHDGLLWLVDPERGTKRVFAETGGGANSSIAVDDGGAVVAQNGGIDMRAFGWPEMADWPDPTTTAPCLQRIGADGAVSVLAGAGLVQSPNDLVAMSDGSIIFTDPPHWPWPEVWTARIIRYRAPGAAPWPDARLLDDDGRLELLDDAAEYRNGVVVSPEGRLLIVAGGGLRWLDPDGGRDWFIEDITGHADGMAFDVNGNLYACIGEGLVVVDSTGTIVERLPLPTDAFTLNCCFGGVDNRTLFVTNGRHSTLLAYEGLPTPGAVVGTWPGDARA